MSRFNLFIYEITKRYFEIIFSIFIILFSIPLVLVLALLIKLNSRGPIFFKQIRIGKDKKLFECFKFRTMSKEADDILNNLILKDKKLRKEFKKTQKLKNDPRITPIGKFLRKTSLDELPQFLNVLKGEMSLIGPRPIVEEEKIRYGKNLNKVLSIKPGITGLWQVSGRNKLSYKRRIKLDLIYVNQRNISMDFNILIRTIGVILFPFDRGAY
tara:strand:- start:161 stop:799 length:639 start_codon:yes stop_codon:yes gene_type:complete